MFALPADPRHISEIEILNEAIINISDVATRVAAWVARAPPAGAPYFSSKSNRGTTTVLVGFGPLYLGVICVVDGERGRGTS